MIIISDHKYCEFSKLSIENEFEKVFFTTSPPHFFYIKYVILYKVYISIKSINN